MADKERVLLGGVPVVMFCAHHNNVNGAKIEAIPSTQQLPTTQYHSDKTTTMDNELK